MKPTLFPIAAVLALVALGGTPAAAETPMEDAQQQEEARAAVKAGLIRPLEDVLAEARKTIDGDIVEIEFEKDDGRYVYEIEYVRRDGQLMEMKIDARSLAVLENDEDD